MVEGRAVGGQPNPPIPDDVPDWHSMRDPTIIRPLPASPHARDVQRLGRQELQRLLRGSQAEQDVLGLLVAARGGLTARDLASLADAPLWEVEAILHTVAGRTLQGRPSLLDPTDRHEVFLLGHEELQISATDYLGGRLADYRERLQSWAAGWRARRWPAETPHYLLAGYFRQLEDLGDLPRMTALARDMARHDRMLDLTGGDAAALAETRTALDRIAASDDPDLSSALALACHRDRLAERNAHIPIGLPAVWALIGQLPHAEALARSIIDPYRQANALTQMTAALARAGRVQQAEAVAAHAETTARSITDLNWQSNALTQVTEALTLSGQYQHAHAVARSITDPSSQASALIQVARALAQAGQHQQAEAVASQAETTARSLALPNWQGHALVKVTEALTLAGQYQHAEAVFCSITDPYSHLEALGNVVGAFISVGQQERAEAVAAQAEAVARSITYLQAEALAQVAGALSQTGQYQHAEDIARSITDPYSQANALAHVAGAFIRIGQYQHAEAVACSITYQNQHANALTQIAGALAQAGQYQHAEAVARSITDPNQHANALTQIAGALAQAGQYQHAEAVARSITDPNQHANALTQIAGALAQAGQYQHAEAVAVQAETIARSITSPYWQAEALAQIAEALSQAGQYQLAEAVARSITDPNQQARVLAQVAGALPWTERYGETEVVPSADAKALLEVEMALFRMDQREHAGAAAALAHSAETAARSMTDPYWQARTLVRVAEAMYKVGEIRSASRVAAATCAVGEWTIAVRPVLLLAPSGYAKLIRVLEEQR
jgi:tetratricopeptide (TPR) repeat protein